MVKQIFILSVLLSVTGSLWLKGQTVDSGEDKMSLLFIGDVMGHDEQLWAAQNNKTKSWNFDTSFCYIKPVISEADFAIANFEVTLGGPPYRGYPRFSAPAALALACKNAGIDVLVTSNNHSADLGKEGITGTIKRLDSLGITHTGTFSGQKVRDSLNPLILRKGNISVALLNYTFSTNGRTVPFPLIVDPINRSLIENDILKARGLNPDKIILFLHWGNEYDTVPSAGQTELAAWLFSKGADIIIGSHPHVIQKMIMTGDSLVNENLVAYSLGNFVSNQARPPTEGGALIRIVLEKTENKVNIAGAGYYLVWVYKPIINYHKEFYVLPCSEYENSPDFFISSAYYKKMKDFLAASRKLLSEQNQRIYEIPYRANTWLLNN